MKRLLILPALLFPLAAQAAEWTVKTATVDDPKAIYGTVESVKTTPARARVEGTIENLSAKEGDEVKAGQVLANVFDAKLKLKLEALDSKIKSLKSEQGLAQTEMNRVQSLIRSGAESQAFLDKAKAAYESLSGALSAAIAERGVTAEQHNEADVLAPTAGRILKVNAVNGSIVQPGETVAEIAASSSVLRLMLPERHARFIKVGDKVMIGQRGEDADPSLSKIEGHISLVYPEIQQGRVVADVEAGGLGGYFVGERARVYISTGSRTTFLVPKAFLITRYGLTFVKRKNGDETPVQTGREDGEDVEILAGLSDGDVLVTP